MNIHQSLSVNRNSRRNRFAFRFVRALARIRMSTSITTQPQQRCSNTTRRIKLAADASMATTIGSRRVWSRAILLKLRSSQTKRLAFVITKKKMQENSSKKLRMKMMMMMMMNKKKKIEAAAVEGDNKLLPMMMSTRANKLRRLVPGGEDMDFCSLLEETAHYIKCLNTQVQVMKSIADIYTS